MQTLAGVEALQSYLVALRRELHAAPELAFEEHSTAQRLAAELTQAGIPHVTGLGGTGLVATLKNGDSSKAVALRADMDALPIIEDTHLPYASKVKGKMHACGHDGHSTMLLGAAIMLKQRLQFNGTVHFIFQPAEEIVGGAQAMLDDGLFARFPVDAIFGLHNDPTSATGTFTMREGVAMAASDRFDIVVRGEGGHAGRPHASRDPLPVACEIVTALQTIVARRVDPLGSAVISVTQIHGGDAYNVIPEQVVIRGGVRSLTDSVRDLCEQALKDLTRGIAAAHGVEAEITYVRACPPLVNHQKESRFATQVMHNLVGDKNVLTTRPPVMGSEDFAVFLREKPGAFAWIGQGGAEAGRNLHNPTYDFNDAIIPLGISYWVTVAETWLNTKM